MTQGRSEEQKIFSDGITVTLGGQEYEIKPLVIAESRAWRKKVASMLSGLQQYANVTTDNPGDFKEAVTVIVSQMPDQMTDLFFEYAKDLKREEIEAKATEAELARGVEAVFEIAFPLLRSLTTTIGKMSL